MSHAHILIRCTDRIIISYTTRVVVLNTIDHDPHTLLKAILTIILWLSAFTVYKQGGGGGVTLQFG